LTGRPVGTPPAARENLYEMLDRVSRLRFLSDMMARVDTEESDIDGRTPHEALAKARKILNALALSPTTASPTSIETRLA
jgi:hypothetical protein